jgi:hypothetical protein
MSATVLATLHREENRLISEFTALPAYRRLAAVRRLLTLYPAPGAEDVAAGVEPTRATAPVAAEPERSAALAATVTAFTIAEAAVTASAPALAQAAATEPAAPMSGIGAEAEAEAEVEPPESEELSAARAAVSVVRAALRAALMPPVAAQMPARA